MQATVLIVEDEPDLALLLSDVLRASGYEVVLTTGSRALERCRELHPAAIVLDYVMPGLSGAEVVQTIRANLGDQAPPFVLVTGLSNADELAQDMQVQAYLRKPFDVDAFLKVVDDLAGSHA